MPQGTARCAVARLASLVDDVIGRIEAPVEDEPIADRLTECHAALEACCEALRPTAELDARARAAFEDLKRLARLLKLIDGPDVPFVLRQIGRVLGRLGACSRDS